MLLGDLFLIDDMQSGDGYVNATLAIEPLHRIFEGHFPGRPVLPGACLVQLVQELVAAAAGPALQLTTAGPVKFIAVVEPARDVSLLVKVRIQPADEGERRVVAEAFHAGTVCFRFTGAFREGSGYAE